MLGALIFMYPSLIGFLIAALVLFAGTVFLYWGYQIWRFKKHVSELKVEKESKPLVYEVRQEGPHTAYRRITMIFR